MRCENDTGFLILRVHVSWRFYHPTKVMYRVHLSFIILCQISNEVSIPRVIRRWIRYFTFMTRVGISRWTKKPHIRSRAYVNTKKHFFNTFSRSKLSLDAETRNEIRKITNICPIFIEHWPHRFFQLLSEETFLQNVLVEVYQWLQ